jgi:glycosyltransferase involved in cell wall biosynthesis
VLKDKKVIVVMPAYNAAKTLKKTYEEVMDQGIMDLGILIDDAGSDDTAKIAVTFSLRLCRMGLMQSPLFPRVS